MNRISIIGSLGGDPETRNAETPNSVVTFSVGSSENAKDHNGNRIRLTEWFRCVAFGPTANFIGKYLRKGDLVYIEGRVKTKVYRNPETYEETKTTEVLIDRIENLSFKEDRKVEKSNRYEY